MAVGTYATCRHVLFDRPHPDLHKTSRPAKPLDEIKTDSLDASGGALVLQACQVLAELPGGQAVSLVLSPHALGLVVAETALIHAGRTRPGAGTEVGDGVRILAMLADTLWWAAFRCLGRHTLLASEGMRISAHRGDTRIPRQFLTFPLVYWVRVPPRRTTLVGRASEGEGMTKRISDYCDVIWTTVLDVACLDAVTAATKIMSAPPTSIEEMIGVFRLPRSVIAEATDFTERHAAACLESRKAFPAMPIPDPWDLQRLAAVDACIRGCIDRIARLAEQNWGLPRQSSAVSRSAAKMEVLSELADRWEIGQRAYHQELQNCNATRSPPIAAPDATSKPQRGKRRRKRHGTTDERLKELASTTEGRQAILAAGTSERIGKLIDRSHAAVAGSSVWKKKIKPLLDANKTEQKLARLEWDERRSDRRKTD